MYTRTGWLATLLTVGVALAGNPVRAQNYEVPPADPAVPLPLYHSRPETGGFFFAGEFLFWRLSNPIGNQIVAIRGLMDTDGSLQVARNNLFPFTTDPNTGAIINAPEPVPGQFFGSGLPALDTEMVGGPSTYQPGMALSLGWRFQGGVTTALTWRHLTESRYSAVASVVPPNFNIGRNGEDQFLFSPVYNFPPEFAGPPNKLAVADPTRGGGAGAITVVPNPQFFVTIQQGNLSATFPTAFNVSGTASSAGAIAVPQAAYGIWNAATIMSIDFVQRHDQVDLISRIPIFQNDCVRWYALAGPRFVWFWERFKWRTVSVETSNPSAGVTVTLPTITPTIVNVGPPLVITGPNITGGTITTTGALPVLVAPALSGPEDVALYTNIVSNRMYGPIIGCGSECYLGHGFSASLDLRAGLLLDVVKERAKFERGDEVIANKRSRMEYTLAPELSAEANIWWYPIEGVQIRVGYDLQTFYNTIAAPQPVDFNYGSLAPDWQKGFFRMIDGFHAGIGFIF